MTHPTEQLAELVDGTLPSRERAVVLDHLQTCARCRQEVSMAAEAKQALSTLPEVQAPVGLGAAAVRRAEADASERAPEVASLGERRDRRSLRDAPAWYRWGGAAGAVAACLLIVVLVLPKVGDGGNMLPAAEDAVDAPLGSAGGFVAARDLEVQERDYDTVNVQELAKAYVSRTGPPPTRAAQMPVATEGQPDQAADAPDALACLERAFPNLTDTGPPIRLIRASFQGTPAYFGVYATGPGADRPADTITVWIAAAEDCTILHSTQVRM